MFEDESDHLYKTVSRALRKAIRAFYKEIEKAGYDGIYYRLLIKVYEMSIEGKVMEELMWNNLERDGFNESSGEEIA